MGLLLEGEGQQRKDYKLKERGEEEGKRMKDGKTERKHVGIGIKQKGGGGSRGKKMRQEEMKKGI
jgi:hypothetical protein